MGFFRDLQLAIERAHRTGIDTAEAVRAQIQRDTVPANVLASPVAGPIGSLAPTPVTLPAPGKKETAMAETIRALKECYPDRWEEIWNDLGKESRPGAWRRSPRGS